ncbi:hypothetical protein SLEP1_g24474 [Rubroshorea leprosula]|uniref:Uncharacterized protein n=1 Tax=Rubroshorea leprosula TaxID=152421 RepID=A0AAV5JPK7_9ROSI|nr:hypothetical protein SLEP1_g24474 [Rubroshorea leprosula]
MLGSPGFAWVHTEPSMPGFGGTQHAWVRFLANPGEPKRAGFASGFTLNPACLGLVRTQHAWVRFLANPVPGFARNPSVLGSRLDSYKPSTLGTQVQKI